MEHIITLAKEAVTAITGVTFEQMNELGPTGKISRKTNKVEARRLLMVLVKDNSTLPLCAIGGIFNGQDHSTVIHALKQHDNYTDTDKKYNELYQKVLDLFISSLDSYNRKNLIESAAYREEVKEKLSYHINQVESCINQLKSAI